MNFVFTCYDFDESGELSLDEMTLSLKSTVTGLCKISNLPIPTLSDFELIAKLAFAAAEKESDDTITSSEFLQYITANPTSASWVSAYDDLEADDDLMTAPPTTPDESDSAPQNLTIPDSIVSESSDANNHKSPPPPPALSGDLAWLSDLDAAKPPAPPAEEGDDGAPAPRPENTAAPNSSLSLSWVHGYSGATSRGNVAYTSEKGIVYPAATVGVVHLPADEENDRPEKSQKFFQDHHTEIISQATSADGSLVATGSKDGIVHVWDASSMKSKLIISSSFFARTNTGVVKIAFNESSTLLACVGNDKDHTLVIFSLTGEKLFSTKTGKTPVLDAAFNNNNNSTLSLVSAGSKKDKPMNFYVKGDSTSSWSHKKGVFGFVQPLALTAVSPIGKPAHEAMVTGTVSGGLLIWSTRNVKLNVDSVHSGAVTSLSYNRLQSSLVSGGSDGLVKVFTVSHNLTLTNTVSVDCRATGSSFLSSNPSVSSACLNHDGSRVLIGTRGNEVFEASCVGTPAEEGAEEGAPLPFPQIGDVMGGGPITVGHSTDGNLNNMAVNSAGTEVATAGDDMKVFVWDIAQKKQRTALTLDSPVGGLSFSPDGSFLTVGYSDGPKKGSVNLFGFNPDSSELELKGSGNEGLNQAAITCVRFAATYIAAATEIGEVYIYGLVPEEETNILPFVEKFTAFDSADAITHMDVSATGMEIIVNSLDSAVYFQKPAEPENSPFGKVTPFVATPEVPAPEFTSCTTPLSAGLQGIYGGSRGSYTSVARPKNPTDIGLVAVSDTCGDISLFPFPTTKFGTAQSSTFRGHSNSGVTDCVFAAEDAALISAGTRDGCVMQWTFSFDEGYDSAEEAEAEAAAAPKEDEPEPEEEEEGSKLEYDSADDEDLQDGDDVKRASNQSSESDFGAVSTFDSSYTPTECYGAEKNRSIPDDDLTLKWVHGVNAQGTRSSVFYNSNGDIIYPAGRAMITYNKANNKQTHFLFHSDAVTTAAIHPDRAHVASGEAGAESKVIVWNTLTNKAVRQFDHSSADSVGVSAVAFSDDGSLLAVALQDAAHTVNIYDWSSSTLKSSTSTGPNKILSLAFSDDNNSVVAAGAKAFYVLSLSGKNTSKKKGQFGRALGSRKVITSAAYVGGDFVLGSEDGKCYRLEGGRKLSGETEVFEKGRVVTLFKLSKPSDPEAANYPALIAGGESGVVKILDETLAEVKAFDLRAIYPHCKSRSVRSVAMNKDGRKLIIATKGSEIFEFSNPENAEEEEPKDINEGKPVITGHSKDQLWGVAAHPIKEEVATCGDDKKVNLWDLETNKLSRSIDVGDFARSVGYSPNGHLLAVGLGGVRNGKQPASYEEAIFDEKDEDGEVIEGPSDPWLAILAKAKLTPRKKEGTVLILSLLEDEIRVVNTASDANGYITDIKFSADGNSLAAASMDGVVYLYDCLNQFVLKGKSESAGIPTLHIDWSEDGSLIMANSARSALTKTTFYDTSSMEAVDSSSSSTLPDASWDTWTATLGLPVKGLYPKISSTVSCVNSISRSKDSSLLVSGDENGSLNLFRYPSMSVGAASKSFGVHSRKIGVSKAIFTKDDDNVVSIGATDRVVCVWGRNRHIQDDKGEKEYGLSDDSDFAEQAGVGGKKEDDSTEATPESVGEEKKEDPTDAVIDWGAVVANSTESLSDLDSTNFELTSCFGFNPKSGVAYNSSGEALYSCGGAAIVYKAATRSQQVYNGNESAVTTLSTSSDGKLALTSNTSGSAKVFDALSGIEVCSLGGGGGGGGGAAIVASAFSSDNSMIATVSNDADHTLSVYTTPSGSWSDGTLFASSANVTEAVSFVTFAGNGSIVTGGFNHAMFWTLESGNLTSRRGIFGEEGAIQPLTCGASISDSAVVTGSVGGSLFEWDVATATCTKKVAGHTRCVNSLSANNGVFVTSGKDGFVKIWNGDLMNVSAFEMGSSVCSANGDIGGKKVLAALVTGELKEIVIDSEFSSVIVKSHRNVYARGQPEEGVKLPGPLGVGCCVAAAGDDVISGGCDGTLRKWSSAFGALPVCEYTCGGAVSCVGVDNGVVAVALGSGVGADSDVVGLEGTIMFLDSENFEDISKVQKPDSGCPSCMVFHNGLAYVGSSDGTVNVFDKNEFKFTVNVGVSGGVIGVDVSTDGNVIGIAGANGDLKFFTPKGDEKSYEDVKGSEWVGGTLPFSGYTKGIEGVCAATKSGESVVYGTKSGEVGTVGIGASGSTHSGAVSGISSGANGTIYTSSASDAGVFVWTKV